MDNNNKCFIFENVITIPFLYFIPLTLFIGFPPFFIYAVYGTRYVGVFGLILIFLLIFGIFKFIINKLKKKVTICINKNFLTINDIEYGKNEILGIYAKDYSERRSSIISVEVWFKNGEKLEITDTEYRNQYNKEKGEMLFNFVKTIETKFSFNKIKKNQFRSFLGRASYLFSNEDQE